jgi:hypothetical protein
MQHLDNFLQLYTLVLSTLILGNMARLFTDYLLTKIK